MSCAGLYVLDLSAVPNLARAQAKNQPAVPVPVPVETEVGTAPAFKSVTAHNEAVVNFARGQASLGRILERGG